MSPYVSEVRTSIEDVASVFPSPAITRVEPTVFGPFSESRLLVSSQARLEPESKTVAAVKNATSPAAPDPEMPPPDDEVKYVVICAI
jgi:hypothetical protein